MKAKKQLIPILSLIFILLLTSTAFAHRMLIEIENEGLLKVKYDDNTSAGFADVQLFDEDNQLLLEGKTDENGYFQYDTAIKFYRLVADDGLGHRARWRDGQTESLHGVPIWMSTLLGISFFLLIAAIIHYRSNQGRKTPSYKSKV
ncbi:hypothetical protein [Tindallia californiensis]|uniref:Nickel transport protein n=1 Tax=Tindallia californiensis TaxID=159292 RepID=A0A1H3P6J8_9FIRM|nr:hypothetical protein [Tindallia californiensis]SDY96593.1 hypothetical protein SAMN05192546_10632 [Tindallia californiensis]